MKFPIIVQVVILLFLLLTIGCTPNNVKSGTPVTAAENNAVQYVEQNILPDTVAIKISKGGQTSGGFQENWDVVAAFNDRKLVSANETYMIDESVDSQTKSLYFNCSYTGGWSCHINRCCIKNGLREDKNAELKCFDDESCPLKNEANTRFTLSFEELEDKIETGEIKPYSQRGRFVTFYQILD